MARETRFRLHLMARPRLYVAALAGLAVAFVLPEAPHWTTRALAGWNVSVWLYLMLIGLMMMRAEHGHLRSVVTRQAQGEAVVLGIVCAAAVASMAAIVIELAAAKAVTGSAGWPHLLFAAVTVVGAWLLLPVLFSLNYASLYFSGTTPGGLLFPGADEQYHIDYVDILYFSFTIAVASQTADVSITSRPMRRLVLVQAVLSFAFNAAILALTINIAAGLF